MFLNEFSFFKEGFSLLGFNYLIHNYLKQKALPGEKNNKRKKRYNTQRAKLEPRHIACCCQVENRGNI